MDLFRLVTEIRSSWRKAIQTGGSIDLELSSTDMVTEESSMNATPSVQEEVECAFVRSEPASPVSDFDLPVSEKKSQLSSTESSSQEQVSISHTFESSDSKTSEIQERVRTESEELDCSTLSGSSVEENVEISMNSPDTCLYSHNKPSSDHCCSFPMDEKLCWSVSVLNSVGHETSDLGILNETLPEFDGIDLSVSASSDSVFNTMDNENLMDGLENTEHLKKMDLGIQSLSNSHEVLKRTASKSEEELHRTHNEEKSENYRAELHTIPEEGEENDDDPSKYSLSSSLVSWQQMDGT